MIFTDPSKGKWWRWFPLWYGGGILFIGSLWFCAARVIKSPLILPGPGETFRALLSLVQHPRFLPAIGASVVRVGVALLIVFPLSLVIGIPAALFKPFGTFCKPLFTLIGATPVLSIILIAFLWFGQERTPIFAAVLMVFPVLTANVIAGIQQLDPGLKEVVQIYRFSPRRSFTAFILPSIVPYLLGGLQSGLSLCWKVVVASEVLLQPHHGLGTGMQQAKAMLETPDLFAWTVVTVTLAGCMEACLYWMRRYETQHR
ncbi:MAG: ABC transporter permease subunit [Treponemataceae bacterium]|nr:ABC transporter permease subunit [Treponemataceae bacterium]